MKTIHLAIIAILSLVIFSSSLAYAEQPLLDFYNNSHLVLVGKIISLSQVPTTSNPSRSPYQTRYDVQVEQYYKNPQVAKLITVYGYAKGIYFGQDPTFNVGDRVFLYLDQENGYYQIQPHSFAINNDCDARPMVPMPTLPFEPPPLSTPAHGRVFEFQSAEGTMSDTFGLGDKIHINFIAENDLPVIKYATLNFTIKTENNTKLIFNDTKQVTVPACNGNIPVSWDFVPKTSGTYLVNVSTSDSLSLGKQTVLFTEPSMGGSFDVRRNTSGTSLEKALYLSSPLTQLRSGIKAEDVKCADGLTLVIKSEDDFPACVKPDAAQKLMARGWAKEIVTTNQTSLSALKLYLSTNSTSIQSGQAIGIDVSLNNTSPQQLTLPVQDNWPINGLGSGGCSFLPIGITILDGYYTEQNMTDKKSLSFYFQPPCGPFNVFFKNFAFQSLSSKAIAECESTDSYVFSCPKMIEMRYNVAYSHVLENGDFQPFNSGVYTVVGGDEWGHVAIRHFTVTNSTGG